MYENAVEHEPVDATKRWLRSQLKYTLLFKFIVEYLTRLYSWFFSIILLCRYLEETRMAYYY